MLKVKNIFITLFVLCLSITLFAGETQKTKALTQKEVIQKFISWDKDLKTLDTFYTQETSFEGTLISKSEGHLLKMGQILRLETLEEGKLTQYALTDKKIINIFDAKSNLITQMLWEDWKETQQNKSLFDFGNYAKILENHKVISFEEKEQGYNLVLAPKEGSTYTLTFLLDKNKFFPKEINLLSEGVNSKTVLQETKI
ncbi:MAG: hypothetical protein II726_02985, partial [Elusimicrobiaceae bacterium]|nr:hypothetical protein [Elusimicrobiaceae bacterium]